MPFALGPRATAGQYRLAAHEAIGSTSTEAINRAKAGEAGRLWVAAKAQTAGHGRRGRSWETPSGNLAASLLVATSSGQNNSAKLGFAAGLALEAAIRACAPGVLLRLALDQAESAETRLRLKWPNDLLIDGAKAAGILLEAVTLPDGVSRVVIGFGVNVLHAPTGLPYPATSLADCGAQVTAETLFEALAEAWVEQEAVWDDGRGFALVRDRWLERAAGLGAPVAVQVGGQVFRGLFETIDEDGRLIVRAADGSAQPITAGDVHFGAAAMVRS